MSEENENTEDGGAESGAEGKRPEKGTGPGREQAPAHVPPHLRGLFTKHEGAVAARPGFRNPSNKKSKKQKGKKK